DCDLGPRPRGQLARAADLDGELLGVLLAAESALDEGGDAAGAVDAGGQDQLATGVDRGAAAGDQHVGGRRPADEPDPVDLRAVIAVGLGGRLEVGLAVAVEDAAALAGQRLVQLHVLRTQARAVALEAAGHRRTALELRQERRDVALTPGDVAV